VALVGEEVTPKSAPWPARATAWGLAGVLLAIDNVAASDPEVAGLKFMLTVQVLPTPRLGEHGVFDGRVNAAALGPAMVTLVMLTAVSPVFVIMTDWLVVFVLITTLPKFRFCAERLKLPFPPVPVRLTVCGLLGASSVIVSVPLATPAVVGVKVTLIVQFEAAARVVPQLSVSANGDPVVVVILVIVSGDCPELLSVTA